MEELSSTGTKLPRGVVESPFMDLAERCVDVALGDVV